MAKIVVHQNFDHWVTPRAVIALKPSPEPITVKRSTADAAIAAGCATEVPAAATPKDAAPPALEASVDGALD